MNLTEYLVKNGNKINGKTLSQPDQNLLKKLDDLGVVVSFSGYAENPITGFTDTLDLLVAALVRFSYKVYSTYDFSGGMNFYGKKVAIGTYDRVKMLVLKLDNAAYSNFID